MVIKSNIYNKQFNLIDNNYKNLKESFNYIEYLKNNDINSINYFYVFYKNNLEKFFPYNFNTNNYNNFVYYLSHNNSERNVLMSNISLLNYQEIPSDIEYSKYSNNINKTINVLKNLDFENYADSLCIFSSSLLLTSSLICLIYSIYAIYRKDKFWIFNYN